MHTCSQFGDRVSHSSLCNVRPAGDGEVANNVRILSELGTDRAQSRSWESAPPLRQFCTVYNTGQVQLNNYIALQFHQQHTSPHSTLDPQTC